MANINYKQTITLCLANFGKQIGAISTGFALGLLLAPFGDLGVVAADEDLGHFPAAEVGGTGVMGKI